MTTATTTPTSAPTFVAYAVRGEGDAAFWHRIGSAWAHQDGHGLSINLAAMPIGGRIVLRTPRKADDEGGAR
ncbi:hypothetical protein GRI58_12885 [Porphyrobacter algicida]|uniref:Uncharacterized protein n=1 Tax=Qipengyuania algicida TaxID=1836209 RepID=A0A845AJB8_9SPHN|nr:hypothetical protein [Qipengyuania algicida]MXP29704.1 hypothetical protein [Qipengyuania algicida]